MTEGVPLGQPGLALAAKLASRVRTAGLEVPLPQGEGVGYELLALAVRAEAEGVDPEAALQSGCAGLSGCDTGEREPVGRELSASPTAFSAGGAAHGNGSAGGRHGLCHAWP